MEEKKITTEKKIITRMYLIPISSHSPNQFEIVNLIANQIGHLNCETVSELATIKYDGLLSEYAKERIDRIVGNNYYTVLYIEAYDYNKCLNNNTINLL